MNAPMPEMNAMPSMGADPSMEGGNSMTLDLLQAVLEWCSQNLPPEAMQQLQAAVSSKMGMPSGGPPGVPQL